MSAQLVALIRSPFTFIYLITGRLKQGWFLRRNQLASDNTPDITWRFKGKRFTVNGVKPQRAQILLVDYLYWYNRLTLQSIWGCQHLTLARLLVTLVSSFFVHLEN